MAEDQQWRFMGIISKNREEWAIVDLACLRSSVTIVPFFDSLGPAALSFVINQTELSTMCCEAVSFDLILKVKASSANSLKNIICFDKVTNEQKKLAEDAGLKLFNFEEVIEAGKKNPDVQLANPKPETVYLFCYTSGTTGDPKGAKMSHSGFLGALNIHEYSQMNFTTADIAISYLPYAHIFE